MVRRDMGHRDGWFKYRHDVWAETVERLPRPLLHGECLMDIRAMQNRGDTIPSRPALRRRWGLSDWKVRSILKELETNRPTSGKPPATNRQTSGDQPGSATTKHDNDEKTSGKPPATNRQTSGDQPANLHTRVLEDKTKTKPKTRSIVSLPLTIQPEGKQAFQPVPAWLKARRKTKNYPPVADSVILAGVLRCRVIANSRRKQTWPKKPDCTRVLAVWEALEFPPWGDSTEIPAGADVDDLTMAQVAEVLRLGFRECPAFQWHRENGYATKGRALGDVVWRVGPKDGEPGDTVSERLRKVLSWRAKPTRKKPRTFPNLYGDAK